jgi:sigma-54 dependent transcriptional regulator, flagellar regulatory protein
MATTARRVEKTQADGTIIGVSPAIELVRDRVRRVGPSAAPVMISGPSGAGKEMVARAIHQASDRADKPFVAINCGAIPADLIESELFGHERGAFTGAAQRRIGRFEEASGGTLFLDEIGDMRFDMQVKLLRVLEDGMVQRVGGAAPVKVDVRIVCATHRDIREEIDAGRFREDLYFRLCVIPMHTPALSERPEDIAPILDHFQRKLGERDRVQFDRFAMARLEQHDWPGNVRELRNVLERARVLFPGQSISGSDMDELLGRPRQTNNVTYIRDVRPEAAMVETVETDDGPINLRELIETLETERIQQALDAADGVVSEAARLLTLKRTTLIEKMRKYRVA